MRGARVEGARGKRQRLRSLGGKRRVVVITDGALAHDAPLSASGMDLQVVTVGDDEDNAAIVRVDIRSGIDPARGPEGASPREQVQVFAMVRNYAPRPRDAFVTLTLAGSADPIASRRVLVGANDKSPVVLTFEPAPLDHGRGLVVRISPGDALALDDVAFGRVPAGLKMPVTIASASSYSWVARALAADPDLDIQKLSLAQLGTVNVDPAALVVVEGACPAIVPGRDAMIVAPPPGTCHGIDVGKSVDNPQLTSWESSDPRFRFLTLDGVHVSRARSLLAQGAGASLLRATETTLIADASIPGRAVTLIGFDVGDSDWPLKASFVLFVRNVVELARLHRAQGVAGPARTGEPLRVAVPTLAPSIRVEGPGVAAHDVAAKGGFAIVPSIDRAGLYRVSWSAPNVGGELIAANLTSELESDIRPRRVVQDGNGDASATPRSKVEDAHNEWGSWLALLAAALLAFDIYWLTRKPAAPTLRKLPKTGGA